MTLKASIPIKEQLLWDTMVEIEHKQKKLQFL